MKIYKNVLETIGKTPLVQINKLTQGANATVLAKLEARNPGGSLKDRICLSMIEEAEKQQGLKPGATLIEPTSGNTGIGLAMVAAVKGYKLILTMPETMSVERRNLLKAYGAQLVLTPGPDGMGGAIKKAEELIKNPQQLHASTIQKPANPKVHRETTGPEIWEDTDGKVDIVVAGVGTGGTITGIAQYIKPQKPELQSSSRGTRSLSCLSGGPKGPHKIQGIGAGFIPDVLKLDLVDEIFKVTDDQALQTARQLAQRKVAGWYFVRSRSLCCHRNRETTRKQGQTHRRYSSRHGRTLPKHGPFPRTSCNGNTQHLICV